jgi:hypothetical protein
MPLKRLAVGIAAAFLFSIAGLATSAQAADFSVVGGGAQSHIGNGLAIPIQQAAINSVTTGTMFPMTLGAGVNGIPLVTGTLIKPLMTAGTKMAYQRKIKVPANTIRKPAGKKSVGVKFSNPTVFAVTTNLNFSWPNVAATLSTGMAPPAVIGPAFGGTLTYSNAIGTRFGGPAAFAISSGDPIAGDIFPQAPVTVILKVAAAGGVSTPPCTHTAQGGANAGCLGIVVFAKPGPLGGVGQSGTIATPGGVVTATANNPNASNRLALKLGVSPLGTNLAPPILISPAFPLPPNAAMSRGGGWTTGMLVVANPAAVPATETWTISGKDARTHFGGGVIQLVSGAVSARPLSGANANRGWVRLVLRPRVPVPSMSVMGIASLVGLMVVAFGYTMRRKLFS